MRILICGDRKWTDAKLMYRAMKSLTPSQEGDIGDTVIEGEANGADIMARTIADLRDITVEKYPADWCDFNGVCQKVHSHHGKRAGMVRNKQMLEALPDE